MIKMIKFLILGVFFSAAVQYNREPPVATADLLLINGKIVTVDENNPRAEAHAVKGDTIIAVGSNKLIKAHIDKRETKIIDLEGKLALPGFNDSHVHFVYGGHALMSISLDGVTSYDEIQRKVKEKVEDKNGGEWIEGRGWDQEVLPGKERPTKELIDSIALNNPVVLERICGHCTLPEEEILNTDVVFTILGGKIIYSSEAE